VSEGAWRFWALWLTRVLPHSSPRSLYDLLNPALTAFARCATRAMSQNDSHRSHKDPLWNFCVCQSEKRKPRATQHRCDVLLTTSRAAKALNVSFTMRALPDHFGLSENAAAGLTLEIGVNDRLLVTPDRFGKCAVLIHGQINPDRPIVKDYGYWRRIFHNYGDRWDVI
jgi:hypothetical protein